jgi:hypothetical protein
MRLDIEEAFKTLSELIARADNKIWSLFIALFIDKSGVLFAHSLSMSEHNDWYGDARDDAELNCK